MELYEKDRTVTRAMALALMRQAQKLLQEAKEGDAADQLQVAMSMLLRGAPGTSVPEESAG